MIVNKITFKNLTTFDFKKLSNLFNQKKFYGFKYKTLEKDVVELSTKQKSSNVLSNYPNIVIGKFDTKIKDDRLEKFWVEFREYTYPGSDDEFPDDYILIDSKNEKRLKSHIYLNNVEVKPEFARQGVYSNVIKQLVQESYEQGCDGRIVLDAIKIESPDMTAIPSPSLAHWKCGFRFTNEENNKIMKRVLSGELPPEDAPEGTMYYSLLKE